MKLIKIKGAATDIRYARCKFCRSLVHTQKNYLDMKNGFQVKIRILSGEVGYPLLSLNELREQSLG